MGNFRADNIRQQAFLNVDFLEVIGTRSYEYSLYRLLDRDEIVSEFIKQPKRLEPFVGNPRQPMPAGLAYRVEDYIELVDWTGRQIREDKRGRIDDDHPPILDRLGIETEHWLYLTQHCQSSFKLLVGTADRVREACRQLGWKKSHGFSNRCLGTLQLFAAVRL